ncbi:uncharacterized protein TNCV_2817711 [Trichonephila clavipes]|nr:uncharacterized protein TNCV_2817711 [Trichonephila clavipes]
MRRENDLFEDEGPRDKLCVCVEKVYRSLLTVLPTSLDAERAFSTAVVVGIVSCDITCYNEEANICIKKFSKEVTLSMDDYCRDQIPLIKCISEAVSKCKMKFVKDAEELYRIHTDACTEGTELNKVCPESGNSPRNSFGPWEDIYWTKRAICALAFMSQDSSIASEKTEES